MDRFSRGWTLAQGSLRILWADKRLLLFALLSSLCTVAAGAAIFLPSVPSQTAPPGTGSSLPLLPLFLFYLASAFITMFFNTALVALVLARMQGQRLSFEEGLWVAVEHAPTIAVFALLSASIGLLLRVIGRRFRLVGELVALLFGAAWGIATLLVVPVMIIEGRGPFSSLSRSVALIRKTWGEQIAGGFGIGLVGVVLAIPGVAVLIKAMTLVDPTSRTACFAGAVVYLALLSLVIATLEQIVRAAVYVYAETGVLYHGFDQESIDGALGPD